MTVVDSFQSYMPVFGPYIVLSFTECGLAWDYWLIACGAHPTSYLYRLQEGRQLLLQQSWNAHSQSTEIMGKSITTLLKRFYRKIMEKPLGEKRIWDYKRIGGDPGIPPHSWDYSYSSIHCPLIAAAWGIPSETSGTTSQHIPGNLQNWER